MGATKRSRVIEDRLAEWAEAEPDRNFVRCGGPWLTFGEVHERSDRLAAGLAEIGVARGERVALISPNRLEYISPSSPAPSSAPSSSPSTPSCGASSSVISSAIPR